MLRGYKNNSIYGYESSSGGKIMFKYSTELRFLLSSSPTVYFILFADAGGVWEDFNNVDIFNLKRSAGFGVRLNMPMLGMIGYDIGYGFDSTLIDGGQKHGWEHHFVFGMPIN